MCDQLIGVYDGITFLEVGNFFCIHKGTIAKEYKRSQSFRTGNGRNRRFTNEEMGAIATFILHWFDLGGPPTYVDIGVFAQECFVKLFSQELYETLFMVWRISRQWQGNH